MIVPASLAPLARSLGAILSPAGGGMFTTPLSPTGAEPATHYVSSGGIAPEFAAVIASGDALYAACDAASAGVTPEQCRALVDGADVSDELPFDAFARVGLCLVHPTTWGDKQA